MATTAVRSCFRAGLDRSGSRGHRPGMATDQVRLGVGAGSPAILAA